MNATQPIGTSKDQIGPAELGRLRAAAPRRVHHFFTSFPVLERESPGVYPRQIVRGEGAFVYDSDGARLLDACQHLGACPIGHGREEMAQAIARQVSTLEFVSLDEGITHPLATALAERLAQIVPVEDPKLYFGSSGSEATETAIKLARVYFQEIGEPRRVKILSRDGSYHGIGYGALSANGNPLLREPFTPLVPGFVHTAQFAPGRDESGADEEALAIAAADDVARVIEREDPSTVAAFLAEPISMHGAVKVPPQVYWDRVAETCRRHGVLLIADEVVNGFGRTGRMFGCERYGLEPDIMLVAKGLTSAYVPMGAAIASRRIADVFAERVFLHNCTYSGHPVAAAAALASLAIIEREGLVANAAALEPVLAQELAGIHAELGAPLRRTAAAGMLSGLEFGVEDRASGAALVRRVAKEAYDRGVLVRGFSDDRFGAIFFYPPLVATEDDVRAGLAALRDALVVAFGAAA